MSSCTDNSDDDNTSSYTVIVDDMSKGIEKLNLEIDDNTPQCDMNIIGGEDNVNSEKKCISCEQKLEHNITGDGDASDIDTCKVVNSGTSCDINVCCANCGKSISDAQSSNQCQKTDISNTCANCGKEGSEVTNICNKCQSVMYCNAACKKNHRSKHKKKCDRRVAELHDEALFKQPPNEDCPLCFLRMPTLGTGSRYMTCCGKGICSGCAHAPIYDNQGNKVDIVKQNECAFCRVVAPVSNEETVQMMRKRFEAGDPIALFNIGNYYRDERNGFPQDYTKALELWHRAAELGHAEAYTNIAYAYYLGSRGVEIDKKKAIYYWELAAMAGDVHARCNLGAIEGNLGNMDRALKHWMIASRDGYADSLEHIKDLYSEGDATKDDYAKGLRAYQSYLDEIKSDQRNKAAEYNNRFKYY